MSPSRMPSRANLFSAIAAPSGCDASRGDGVAYTVKYPYECSVACTMSRLAITSELAAALPPSRGAEANQPKLRLICVGTGRDGTMSLSYMMREIYERIGGGRVAHEYGNREFYQAFCEYKETGDPRYLAEIRRLIDECPYECIVGNGYAPILPIIAEQLVDHDVALVHLRRMDREACVASLKLNAELLPAAYGYYVNGPQASVKRMAAFHFGDLTQAAWDALSLTDKMRWYYDKTHALVAENRHLFRSNIEIVTAELDSIATREALSRIVAGTTLFAPSPVHVNTHLIDMQGVPRQHWDKAQWLLGGCDFRRVVQDDVYAIEYFLRRFTEWMGHEFSLIRTGAPDAREQQDVLADMDRACGVLWQAHQRIEALRGEPCADAERQAAAARIRQLEEALEAERLAAATRISEMRAAHASEHLAAATRISELGDALVAERQAAATRIGELRAAHASERQAAAARLDAVEAAREADMQVARASIEALQAACEAERREYAAQLAAASAEVTMLQATLSWRVTRPLRAMRRMMWRFA